MTQSNTITLTPGAWTQLTDGDTTNITFQNLSGVDIQVMGTAGATPPSDADGAFTYAHQEGEKNVAITDLFLGVSGANRLYALGEGGSVNVVVSHA